MKNFKIVFLIVLGLSCNDKENNLKDENIKTLKEINKELNLLEYVLKIQGVDIDSLLTSGFNEKQKIEYFRNQLLLCRVVTNQYTRFDIISDKVKIDSIYQGSLSLVGYNRNVKNKMVLNYDNTISEIPIDEDHLNYKFKIKPKFLGENFYEGFLIQDKDTYRFKRVFYVQ